MHGFAFDLSVLRDAVGPKFLGDPAQECALGIREGSQPFDDLVVEEVDHPLGLHDDSGAVQSSFAQVLHER